MPCVGLDSGSNMLCVLNLSACIKRLYNIKLNGKTQKLADNANCYATDWFFPQNYITRKTKITENTVAVHHYSSAWFSPGKRAGVRFAKGVRMVLGRRIFGCFERIARRRMLGKLKKEYKKRGKGAIEI